MYGTDKSLELITQAYINTMVPITIKLTYHVDDPMVIQLHLPTEDVSIYDNIWIIGRDLFREAIFGLLPSGTHEVNLVVINRVLHIHLSNVTGQACISMKVNDVSSFIGASYGLMSAEQSMETSVNDIIKQLSK